MRRVVAVLVFVLAAMAVATPSFAETAPGGANVGGFLALGAGLGIGIAAFGVAIGQGLATAAAMESIGRNPNAADKLFLPLVLTLALLEALALYGFVIAIILSGKI